MRKAVIEFKNFSFKYRVQKLPSLSDINLTIYEGEKVLIVGPSGSGKSTLANCINGLVPFSYAGVTEGDLRIKDQNPAELGIFGLSKLVGTVLQDTDGQFVGLTVAEDIAFSLENDCMEQSEMLGRVAETAGIVELTQYMGHSPQALSGGQKQRVSLGGVLVDNVDILLFDEPLANLDPATGKYAMELIDRIHRDSKATILIVEHRLEDVLHCNVDRVIVMTEGRIVADTVPSELLSSDILKKTGIREPLYITSLKYAGCDISASIRPELIDSIVLEDLKDKLVKWHENNIPELNEPQSSKLLELKNISFGYEKNRPVLTDINFDIYKGEMVGLVGQNGAGKSTLSKIICGFEKPSAGTISLNGKSLDTDSIAERAQKIGLVMQNPNHMLSKPMLFDEVALGLVTRGKSKEEIDGCVFDVLKICGLYEFRNWPISALSYGQKKRVTIASILVLKPEVIILDEPTAGQDFRHYTEFMEFLLKLNRERGTTILMITHDMHLLLEYTERSVVLAGGRVIADARPALVLTNDEIINKASLKRTSLYELAMRTGIKDSRAFVQHFIDYDRRIRSNGADVKL